jgi:succinoglycan biosynthesis transport protein ExoP
VTSDGSLLPRPNDPAAQGAQGAASAAGAQAGGGDEISSLLRIIRRRRGIFLATLLTVSGLMALNTLRQRLFSPVYQGRFIIQTRTPFDTSTSARSAGPVGAITEPDSLRVTAPNLSPLLRSPLLLQAIAEREKVSTYQLANLIDITNPEKDANDLVQVRLRWGDPVKGQQILEDLARTYISFSSDQRLSALDSGVRFLDRQAPDLQARMDSLQNQLKRFREANNFLEPQQQGSAIQNARDNLTQQLRGLQVQQAELESQLASVNAGRLKAIESFVTPAQQALGNTTMATAPRAPGGNGGGSTPFQDLLQVEKELSTARATFTDDAPVVRTLTARRDQLFPVVQKQAADAINARLLSNTAQQNELNRQILELNRNFLSSPSKIKEYEELQQRLSVARENYASYIKSRETYRLELARATTPWQIISPPEFSGDPFLPNIPRSFLLALGVGFASAVAAAWLRERTDNLFHSPQEVSQSVQMPVLGLIPFLPLDPSLPVSRSIERLSPGERFAIKESLRSLFTTFRMLSADHSLRLVGITSTSQGEGKSLSVAIFARTLADLGMKVLVVDADMRLPTQTRYMGAEPADGFSRLLSDSSTKAVDLIRNVHDNLDLLPAGQKAPDPARLLNSARCADVIQEIRGLSHYDLILFDAPPCLMLADPILLGEKLDGVMFLVGLGVIAKDVVNQAMRRVKSSGVDLLGVICNQASFPTRLNDYGYEYGYYYHYSYTSSYADAAPSGPGYASRYVKDAIADSGATPANGKADRSTEAGNGSQAGTKAGEENGTRRSGLGSLLGQRRGKRDSRSGGSR